MRPASAPHGDDPPPSVSTEAFHKEAPRLLSSVGQEDTGDREAASYLHEQKLLSPHASFCSVNCAVSTRDSSTDAPHKAARGRK